MQFIIIIIILIKIDVIKNIKNFYQIFIKKKNLMKIVRIFDKGQLKLLFYELESFFIYEKRR